MNRSIRLYYADHCPYCDRAKSLLDQKGLDYEGIDLTGNEEELLKLKERTGLMTIPQIFIGDELIGGFSELSDLEERGLLEEKLRP